MKSESLWIGLLTPNDTLHTRRLISICREVISDVFYASSKVRSYYSPPMDVDALTEAALKVFGRITAVAVAVQVTPISHLQSEPSTRGKCSVHGKFRLPAGQHAVDQSQAVSIS